MRVLLAVALVSLAVLWLGVRLFAPQVLVLAREGFPASVMPTHGSFAPVSGAKDAPLPRAPRPMPAAALARFEAAEGRALLVVRDGAVVLEAYGNGAGPETLLNSYSLVKSLVGALVLKALAEGRIASLDLPLRTWLPEGPEVSLRAVLEMTSGLSLSGEPPKDEKPVDDADFSPFGAVARLQAFGVAALMPRLQVDPALRGVFHYQSVNTALLGQVLARVYGQPLEQVLAEQIWQPAGAADAFWRVTPGDGAVSAWCCLYARAEDWARVGLFLMQNRDGFLPEPLWRAWLMPDFDAGEGAVSYGWQIRHDVLDRDGAALRGRFVYMAGHKGQRVYLMPDRATLVVRFGEREQLLHSTLYELLE